MSKSKEQSCCLPWFVYVLVGLITGFIAVGTSSFYSSHNFQFVWPLNWPLIITEAAQPQTAEVTPQETDLGGSSTANSSTDSSSQVATDENRTDHVHIGSKVLVLEAVHGTAEKRWGTVAGYYEGLGQPFPYRVKFKDGDAEGYPYCVGEFIEVEQKDPFNSFKEL
jgi:hypothetical protein